jgi:hypothetical protein
MQPAAGKPGKKRWLLTILAYPAASDTIRGRHPAGGDRLWTDYPPVSPTASGRKPLQPAARISRALCAYR